MIKLIVTSGYFNPIHIGHIRYLESAKDLGDKLIVIVNNDHQQILKKGKIIMNEHERLQIVSCIRFVDEAVLSIDRGPSVMETLERFAKQHSDARIIFANGGDRKDASLIPEVPICEKYCIEMLFNVGGNDKPNSSSNINKLLNLE